MTGDLTGKTTTVVDMADYLALEAERDEARAEVVSLKRSHQLTVADLEIDRARAATVLRQVEWILPPDVCPICYGGKQDGHAFECALKVALLDVSDGGSAGGTR